MTCHICKGVVSDKRLHCQYCGACSIKIGKTWKCYNRLGKEIISAVPMSVTVLLQRAERKLALDK